MGQFPPPVTGFSHITECVVKALRTDHDVVQVNIGSAGGARSAAKHLDRVGRTLGACLLLARMRLGGRSRTCYVACEGALGLAYTLVVISCARLFGFRILLHHHSFNYVDNAKLLMRAVLTIGGDLVHVFLCSDMRDKFERTYARISCSVIVSNAAFVAPLPFVPRESADAPLVLGHLSNLTREKGLYLFLDLLRRSVKAGKAVRGVLAGPVQNELDRQAIEEACADLGPALTYRGPLYGEQKDAFYNEIDVFVFGTTYVNEAQPTVLFESLAAGAKVLSYDRGCIARQVVDDGLAMPKTADFVVACEEWLERNESQVRSDRPATRARYMARHQAAQDAVAGLLKDETFAPARGAGGSRRWAG